MTATAPTAVLVPIQPAFSDAERLALAGFLAGYRSLTREAYALDLRQFATWCRAHSLPLFAVRRADIESFARDLEARGRPRYRHPPAVHHRRVLQVRHRRGAPGALPGRPCPAAAAGLRISRHRPGPQPARRPAGRGRARPATRARADLPARPERAAGAGGRRRRHRAAGPRTRPPDA